MFVDAPATLSPPYPSSGGCRIGRSYSSSASSLATARTGFFIGETQKKIIDSESIQNRIGAIFDQFLPQGVTGLLKDTPSLIITIDGNSSKLDRNIVSIIQPTPHIEKTTADISFKSQLEAVQEDLGLSITQLAQLFGVTRKAVYDWLDGSEPRANISSRMELISSLIRENNSNLNLKRLKGVWLTAVNGSSLIDILANEDLSAADRLAAAIAKVGDLAPRLGQENPKLGKTYLGNAHANDIDRVADLG